MDYSIYYKSKVPKTGAVQGEWDLFLSAYNLSNRVRSIFDRVQSRRKVWVVHEEYKFSAAELPERGESFVHCGGDESIFCVKLLEWLNVGEGWSGKICVDVTGFLRPHMMCLIAMLESLQVSAVDVLYTEPRSYSKKESTKFSKGRISSIRQVAGLEGFANTVLGNDLLVVGAGYDNRLITEVAHHKEAAQKVAILGFPPLRADMYQQNLLRTHQAEGALGPLTQSTRFFAPANDPFVTACVVRDIVTSRKTEISNLYLCPLATKPQALGFVLYFVTEGKGQNCSVIFPFSEGYEKETSKGVARTWHYVLEFGK